MKSAVSSATALASSLLWLVGIISISDRLSGVVGQSTWSCTPFKMIHTRASSSRAEMANGTLSSDFPVENVNNANIMGALYSVITESTGESNCQRKGNVSYIDFYLFTICQPINATWWFSPLKPSNYGGQPQFNYRGLGQYVRFDDGGCHEDDPFCVSFNGNATFPPLGKYIGWKNLSSDEKAPTPGAYGYSLPGACPEWNVSSGNKTEECEEERRSGRCTGGKMPDGRSCTYAYSFLGQISLDDLVGISSMGYKSYQDFCQAGNVEFLRNPNSNELVKGLPFWEKPTDPAANLERIRKMLELYSNKTANPGNKPIPEGKDLKTQNPPCFCNFPQCVSSRCKYDDSQVCVPCSASDPDCEVVDSTQCRYGLPSATTIQQVRVPEVPTTLAPSDPGSQQGSPTSKATSGGSFSTVSSEGLLLASLTLMWRYVVDSSGII